MGMVWGVEEVAAQMGVTGRALRMRLFRGTGAPQPMRLGGRLCWRPADVEAWLEKEAKSQGVAYSLDEVEPISRRRGRPRKDGR